MVNSSTLTKRHSQKTHNLKNVICIHSISVDKILHICTSFFSFFFLSTLWKYYLNPLWIKRLMIRNVLVVLWGLHLTWWVYFPYLLFSEFPCWLWVLPFYICLGVDSWISYIWTLGFVNLHVHFFLQTWKVSGYESFK